MGDRSFRLAYPSVQVPALTIHFYADSEQPISKKTHT